MAMGAKIEKRETTQSRLQRAGHTNDSPIGPKSGPNRFASWLVIAQMDRD